MEFVFYLAFVKHSSIEENLNDESIETDIPKMYFKVQTLIEFDSFAVTHGPGTYVDGEYFLACIGSCFVCTLHSSANLITIILFPQLFVI